MKLRWWCFGLVAVALLLATAASLFGQRAIVDWLTTVAYVGLGLLVIDYLVELFRSPPEG